MPTPTPRVSVRTRKVALITMAVISFSLVIAATVVTYLRHQPQVQRINYSELYTFAAAGNVTASPIVSNIRAPRAESAESPHSITAQVATVPLHRAENRP